MVTKVQKRGNSQGLRLNEELLSDAGIDVGDAVDVIELAEEGASEVVIVQNWSERLRR